MFFNQSIFYPCCCSRSRTPDLKLWRPTFFLFRPKVLECSKTDVYREGRTVLNFKTDNSTCPVNLLSRYCVLANIAPDSTYYLFRHLCFCFSSVIFPSFMFFNQSIFYPCCCSRSRTPDLKLWRPTFFLFRPKVSSTDNKVFICNYFHTIIFTFYSCAFLCFPKLLHTLVSCSYTQVFVFYLINTLC
jgi:endogenous inhibitor of DNA gyrase (YacG/DUF329 family)